MGPWGSLRDKGPRDSLSFPLPTRQKLEAANFDEKKEINKRKQLILEGKVRTELAGGGGGEPGGRGPSAATSRYSPCQDPDLEAKRKAELAKIKQKNRRFKEKVERELQRQKAGGAGRRARPPRAPPEGPSAPAPTQGQS